MPDPASTVSATAPCAFAPSAAPHSPVDSHLHAGFLPRVLVFTYGLICYAIFFATFLYAFAWVANLGTPTALDALPSPSSPHWALAMLINLALLTLFAAQHSIMARPWFKSMWTRLVPEPAERSTYVLFSSLALILMFAFWQPLGGVVWHVQHPLAARLLLGIMILGWLLVLVSTFLINHFDLFGLRQVWLFLRNRRYFHLPFAAPSLYRHVRHPLYLGWFIAFWATPTMTVAHLVFAIATTAYILAAIRWEERDLSALHGRRYNEYRGSVPMLVPALAPRVTRSGDPQ